MRTLLALLLLLASATASVAQFQFVPLPPVYQSGTITPGHSAKFCSNGVICDGGVIGSGTVNSGTKGEIAYYASAGTAVSGDPQATLSGGSLALGAPGIGGAIQLWGTSSGFTTIKPASGAGSWVLTLPTGPGTSGQTLTTDGSGNASWTNSGSGSGTVNSGLAGQLGYYAANGTTISGNVNANISLGALTLGQAGSVAGSLVLGGSSSGTVTVAASANAGSWTMTLPTGAGTVNQVLTTDGTGTTSWSAGGGGTPGGSSGQVQYNNSGAFGGFTLSGDCTLVVATGVITCTQTNGVPFGTFATQNYATPPIIGATTPNSATFSAITDSGITGSTQCLHVNSSGLISGTGSDCTAGGGGSATFHTQDFIGGTDFTPGTTTSLTVSSTPASAAALAVYFDGVKQDGNTWSLATATITFNAAIPLSTQVVEAQYGSISGAVGVNSITSALSTLTCSPSTGSAICDINTAHANTYTATQTFPNGSITNAELAHSTITLGTTAMSLGNAYTTIAGAITWTGTQTLSNGTFSALFTGGPVGIGSLNTSPVYAFDVWGQARFSVSSPGGDNNVLLNAGSEPAGKSGVVLGYNQTYDSVAMTNAAFIQAETQGVGNRPLYLNPLGGAVTISNNVAPPAGGTTGLGLTFSSTANFGIFFGTGVPTLTAQEGSLYIQADGARPYVNSSVGSGNTWHPVGLPPGGTQGEIIGFGTLPEWDDTCFNIEDFGGATSLSDNTTAFSAAFALISSPGGCIYFPSGKWNMGSHLTFTFPAAGALFHLTIKGDGPESTTLNWAAGGGLSITYQNNNTAYNQQGLDFRDLSVTTGSVNTGTALALTQNGSNTGNSASPTNIINVVFRGDGAFVGTNSWANDIIATGISNLIIGRTIFQGPAPPQSTGPFVANGNGLIFQGLPSNGGYATVLNIYDSSFTYLSTGFTYGRYVQGVSIDSTNFTGHGVAAISAPAFVASTASYNNGTGALTLTFSSAPFTLGNGQKILVELCGGSGLNGNWTLTSGAGSSTLVIAAPASLGAPSTTGCSVAEYNAAQLAIKNSQFGVYNPGTNGIVLSSYVNDFLVNNNTFGVASPSTINDSFILMVAPSNFSIVGNQFQNQANSGNFGINVASSNGTTEAGTVGTIVANTFQHGLIAVNLGAGSSGVTVVGNQYSAASFNVSNSGTSNLVQDNVPGVTCSGAPTGSFATAAGIVTHC